MKLQGLLCIVIVTMMLTKPVTVQCQEDRIMQLFKNSDTTAVIDSLLKDFDRYLDSITKPSSFFSISLTAGTGIFSFESSNTVFYSSEKKLLLSPAVSYFHRSGFGITASAFMINNEGKVNPYQYSITPSYDLIRHRFSTGLSYSRFIQKDSLDFYTTPIQNEVFGYFSYKNWPVRPTLGVSYGWGSKTSFEQKKIKILKKRLKGSRNLYVTEKTEESISDLSLMLSVRKDFNFHNVLLKRDLISLTPVLIFNAGTQQYGFNTSYSMEASSIKVNVLPSSTAITDKSAFLPQSLAMVCRVTYMKSRYILQPQVLFDYYLPAGYPEPFSVGFSVTGGISF